jgi:hypothetical protein
VIDGNLTQPTSALSEVSIRSAVMLDWYDGPREGIFTSETGAEWHFAVFGESVDPDTGNLYALRRLRDGAVANVTKQLAAGKEIPVPLWIPEWTFTTDRQRRVAEALLDEILSDLGDPQLLVHYDADLRPSGAWRRWGQSHT